MEAGKYYDWARNRVLAETDGCPYAEWSARHGTASFAVHPKGFLVFLDPERLERFDEYAEGDPYGVESDRQSAFQRRRFEATLALVCEALAHGPARPRIVDLGCGEGHITAEIRKTFPQAQLSGCDGSLTAISRAVEAYPGIDFAVADACEPIYRARYFDGAVCNNLWEHIPDPFRLLETIRRIVRPGGFLIISTPSRYRLLNLLRIVRGKPALLGSSKHVTEYSVGQVLEHLKFSQFEICKIDGRDIECRPHGLKSFVAYRLLRPVIAGYLRLTHSHHSLAATVFYLARVLG